MTRQEFVDYCKTYFGMKGGSSQHLELIDTFNSFVKSCKRINGLPRTTQFAKGWAWCAQFASTMAIKCGMAMETMPVEMSCTNLIKEAQAMGIWEEDESIMPSVGDWVIYDWDDGTDYANTDNKGGPEHVGIVVEADGSYFKVIEGNYSNQVKYRDLKRNARYLRGFIRPKFPDEPEQPKPTPAPAPAPSGIHLPILIRGSKGADVKVLQAMLNYKTGAGLEIDGSFGSKTEAAVIFAQKGFGVTADGEVGPITWARLIAM